MAGAAAAALRGAGAAGPPGGGRGGGRGGRWGGGGGGRPAGGGAGARARGGGVVLGVPAGAAADDLRALGPPAQRHARVGLRADAAGVAPAAARAVADVG